MIVDTTITLPFMLTAAAMIYTWWRTRDNNTDTRFKAGSDRMGAIEKRLADAEHAIRSMPAREDMHGLAIALEGMKGEMKAMRAEMSGTKDIMARVEDVVSRHEQHLMDSRK